MVNHLEYYKTFYYVAKCGGFTSAAEQLSISQPAVSQGIKQLETLLGVTLFSRVSKGVVLTKEGQLLFSYVSKGYEQIELGEQKLKQMLQLDFGDIRIGASDMTLQFYLLPFLEQFHEACPNIKINVTNAPTPETLQKLNEGVIDFGIVSTPFQIKDDTKQVVVKEIEDIFVGGRRFTKYKNKTLDILKLEEMPLIVLEHGTSSRTYMEAVLQEHGVKTQPEFELATSDMIVQFTLRNLGIGFVMKEFAKEFLDSGQLFELRFNTIIPKRHICVVINEKNPLSVAAKKLLEMITM